MIEEVSVRWLVERLAGIGVRLAAREGVVMASPEDLLKPAHAALVRAYQEELLAYMEECDAISSAIAERAFLDPPDFSQGHVQERQSVIVRLPGFPVQAFSPEQVEAWLEFARCFTPRDEKKRVKT